MMIDDIMFDAETACIKKGEVYLFSDSFLALKHYEKNMEHIENNKINKKYGYVYKGVLKSVTKKGKYPFHFDCCGYDVEQPIQEKTVFVCRI